MKKKNCELQKLRIARAVVAANFWRRGSSDRTSIGIAMEESRLVKLSYDEAGIVGSGLADPLQPRLLVDLGRTCKGLRAGLQHALAELRLQHEEAKALLTHHNAGLHSSMKLREVQSLDGGSKNFKDLTPALLSTLAMLLRTNGLPRMESLGLAASIGIGAAGMQQLCLGLSRGALRSVSSLSLNGNDLGPAGAVALAAALRGGALSKLRELYLASNDIGNQGAAALAPPLRKLPALFYLVLSNNNIGDEGVTALFANLAEGDFGRLESLIFNGNHFHASQARATLRSACNVGGLPSLVYTMV